VIIVRRFSSKALGSDLLLSALMVGFTSVIGNAFINGLSGESKETRNDSSLSYIEKPNRKPAEMPEASLSRKGFRGQRLGNHTAQLTVGYRFSGA
jgi:hypothetical protein